MRNIHVSGYSHFGSGDYSASSSYTGEEPEFVEGSASGTRDSFVADSFGDYRFKSPSVVFASQGDGVNGGRNLGRTIFVCATDAQIEEACREVARQRAIDCADADLDPLKAQLIEKWERAEKHAQRFHHGGCCWAGRDASEMHAAYSTNVEYLASSEGKVAEAAVAQMPEDVALAIRRFASLPETERKAFWESAQKERDTQKKAAGKEFARQQHLALTAMGFRPKAAREIISAAGPGRAVQAAEWAIYAHSTIGSADALDCLLLGAGGANSFGKDRMEAALRVIGLEPPESSSSYALFAILKGAHQAIVARIAAVKK